MQNLWFSTEVKKLTIPRDEAYLRWKRNKTDEFRKQYKEARVNKKIKSKLKKQMEQTKTKTKNESNRQSLRWMSN